MLKTGSNNIYLTKERKLSLSAISFRRSWLKSPSTSQVLKILTSFF